MSRKRVAGDALLTGGTKDVNPQFLSNILVMSAANAFTELSVGIPIQRISPQKSDRAIIMEILRLYVDMPEVGAADISSVTVIRDTAVFTMCTASQGTVQFNLGNTRCLMANSIATYSAFTAAGTFMQQVNDNPVVFDFTDEAGHGILVATDNLFFGLSTAGYAAAGTAAFKVLYRWKEVGLTEYIGIVQSQQ